MNARRIARFGLFCLVAAAALIAFVHRDRLDLARLDVLVAAAGTLGPLIYVATFAVATTLFVPGAIFGIAGGALFGPVWGTVWNLLGATIGGALSFLIARYLAADWVGRKAGGLAKRLIAGVEAEGWRFVAVARLAPFVPFNLLNYALGLTRIRFDQYVLTTLVCMIPGAAAITWLGYAGKEALAGEASAIRYSLLALGLLTLIAFLPRFVRRLRGSAPVMIDSGALRAMLRQADPPLVLDVRSAREFNAPPGHIAASLNMPIDEVSRRLPELDPVRRRRIAVVCHTDKRSTKVAEILREAGFHGVEVLSGGIAQWHAAGHPLVGADGTDRKEG